MMYLQSRLPRVGQAAPPCHLVPGLPLRACLRLRTFLSRPFKASPLGGSSSHAEDGNSSSKAEMPVTDGVSFASLPVSQQCISMAFQILDKDEDGRISRAEAYRLVAYYLALQDHRLPPARRRPLTWDQYLLSSAATANKLSGGNWAGIWAALEAFVCAKATGGLQAYPPRCSDLVWASLGMGAAVILLGVLAAAAKTLPVVGHWHQQGVPLLLGSFGTLAILLFGKPEAEPVRLWPIIAGQVGATAIVMAVLQVAGANLISRAAAMAAAVAWMMWSDSIHPPGGALVLMAMDNAAVQQMSWAYLLWPSLAISLSVLLPISAATNWLRLNYQFDAPWSAAGAATLQQKVQEWQQQQAAKQAAILRQFMALEADREGGAVGRAALHVELHSPMARLVRVLRPITQLLSFPQSKQPKPQKQQQQQQRQQQWPAPRNLGPQQPNYTKSVRFNLDLRSINLGSSIGQAGSAEAAAAAALDAAIRRRLWEERERKIEDDAHMRRIWGGSQNTRKRFEENLEKLHQQRTGQKPDSSSPSSSSPSSSNNGDKNKDVGKASNQSGIGSSNSTGSTNSSSSSPDSSNSSTSSPNSSNSSASSLSSSLNSPRQRLERHWSLAAQVGTGSTTSSSSGSGKQHSQSRSSSRSSSHGAPDSFAPEDE